MTNTEALAEIAALRRECERRYQLESRFRVDPEDRSLEFWDRRLTALAKAADALKRSKDP